MRFVSVPMLRMGPANNKLGVRLIIDHGDPWVKISQTVDVDLDTAKRLLGELREAVDAALLQVNKGKETHPCS